MGLLDRVASAYHYLRVVAATYLREGLPGGAARPVISPALQISVGEATVIIGLWPAPVLDPANMAALTLLSG